MKSFTTLLITTLVLFFLLQGVACKKALYLPDETKDGRNKVGCKINGKVWLPSGSDGYSFINPKVNFYKTSGYYKLRIVATNYDRDPMSSLIFQTNSIPMGQSIIQLNNCSDTSSCAWFSINRNTGNYSYYEDYSTTNTVTGFIQITYLNLTSEIISGRFEFTAISSSRADTLKVTEGRFDLPF